MSHVGRMLQQMSLTPDQELIAQFMATQPHSGGIHMQNYRKAAQEENFKHTNQNTQAFSALRTELQAFVTQNTAALRTELQNLMKQHVDTLNTDIAKRYTHSVDKITVLTDSNESMKCDVEFVRHELKAVGSRLTTLHHLITNQNKCILDRIESVEKELIVLKTPKKSEFQWFEFVLCLLLVVVPAIGFFLKRSESNLMRIGY